MIKHLFSLSAACLLAAESGVYQTRDGVIDNVTSSRGGECRDRRIA